MNTRSYQQIKEKLMQHQEIAIIDLREEHIFAQGHPLFASNISLSRLEIEIYNRVPRLDTELIIYADSDDLLNTALLLLEDYGYTEIFTLENGIAGWQAAGGELFIDVNSASKAFGEWVEHFKATPSLSPEEVQQLIQEDENILILDARRFDEYQSMSIPKGISVPGAELVLRAQSLTHDANTKIIVNCAGRTRSIIGTQSLINAEIPHEVYALRNGTIGWTLANQKLNHAQTSSYQDHLQHPIETSIILERVQKVAERAKVKTIGVSELEQFKVETQRTTYLFDVRCEHEYRTGHYPESRWVAGGQLVQEIDHYAAVRGAKIVLIDDQKIRAYMTASWLAQMNWNVYVLDISDTTRFNQIGAWTPRTPLPSSTQSIQPIQLKQWITEHAVTILDFTTAVNYKKEHIPTARWALKADLPRLVEDQQIDLNQKIVVTCGSSLLAQYAVPVLEGLGAKQVYVLEGGNQNWLKHGFDTVQNNPILLSEEIDRYKRPYEGTDNSVEAMQAYLDWEYGLVEQLKKDASHGFFVI